METSNNNKTFEEMSTGPGLYSLEESRLKNKISYPWAPTVRLQHRGGSVMENNFMDVDSELKNITRKLSNNPQEKYIPGKEDHSYSMILFWHYNIE